MTSVIPIETNGIPSLLPCPFCGGESRLMAQHFTDDSHIYWVGCRRCGMGGPHMHDGGPAIVAWNGMVKERTCEMKLTTVGYACSECHVVDWHTEHKPKPKYCPNCGARVIA